MLSKAKHLCISLKKNTGIVRCAHDDKHKNPSPQPAKTDTELVWQAIGTLLKRSRGTAGRKRTPLCQAPDTDTRVATAGRDAPEGREKLPCI